MTRTILIAIALAASCVAAPRPAAAQTTHEVRVTSVHRLDVLIAPVGEDGLAFAWDRVELGADMALAPGRYELGVVNGREGERTSMSLEVSGPGRYRIARVDNEGARGIGGIFTALASGSVLVTIGWLLLRAAIAEAGGSSHVTPEEGGMLAGLGGALALGVSVGLPLALMEDGWALEAVR